MRPEVTPYSHLVEFSLRDIIRPDDNQRVDTLLEIEALHVATGDESAAADTVRQTYLDLGIATLNEAEWGKWVQKTHREVDQPYTHTPDNAHALALSLAEGGWIVS